MSKRHQHNRRKSYGRRQHELHERRQREPVQAYDLGTGDDLAPTGLGDRLAFIDRRSTRLHYALGD